MNYTKTDWGAFSVISDLGVESTYYSKSYIVQNFKISYDNIRDYLSLNLLKLKITEDGVEKVYHLIKKEEVEAYIEFTSKHKDMFPPKVPKQKRYNYNYYRNYKRK